MSNIEKEIAELTNLAVHKGVSAEESLKYTQAALNLSNVKLNLINASIQEKEKENK